MRERGSLTIGLGIALGVMALITLGTATWAQRQAEKRAQAEAAMAQWQATAMECSDATQKAAKEASERNKRALQALEAARKGSASAQAEIARLRASKSGTCEAAVATVRQGLSK